ncbi:MAG TPA: cellulose binding domain-containing protein [Candidatus Limnocylindrales bacterium]
MYKAAAILLVLAAGTLAAPAIPAGNAAAAAPATVTVNARAGLARMPATGLGINHAVWDGNLGTTRTSDLLSAAGVRMIRYPGGSYGDIYHWETHTAPGGFVAPGTDFDTFIAGVRRTGAEPMIIANYGTGTPAEAAGWVRHANIVRGYGVRYWTIGNENYGNGHYGAAWEADNHPDKSATFYAGEVVAHVEAMKAVDPTIKVGAVLTMPANWPDGITAGTDPGSWNQAVLSIAGPKIDFVDVHWYPGGGTAAEALSKTEMLEDSMFVLRQQMARYAGRHLEVSLTELNVGTGPNTQPGALFLADAYSSLLAQGVFTVQWWNVRNGIGTVSTQAGQTDYGDFGILSSGTCTADGSVCEPPLDTPFAPYYGMSMMNIFAKPGDQFLRTASDQPLLTAHAVRRANGELAVLLLNKDPDNAVPVELRYAGYAPSAAAPTVYSFTNGASTIAVSQSGSATSQTLPPYSLTTVVLRPANPPFAGPPGAPGQPAASAVTDRTATVSWPTAAQGTHPIAKYEIYRQRGTTSEQWGETPATSFTVGNLEPGNRYTINVLARDTAGNLSWASPPLTFRTGGPAGNSTCAVRFSAASDWGNGYIGTIDITNTGSNPIDGWTLSYTWPTGWQRMDGGWNANWVQTGRTVQLSNLDWNRRLEPGGGAASAGFVGGYSGPNIAPLVFTLNGTICTTLS